MDRAQLLNDSEEAQRLVLDGRQSKIWTAMPGIIQSINFSEMTCEVLLAIKGRVEKENGDVESVNYPILLDVPIVFPSGGGFTLTFPLAVNDEVLVVFSSRCIDAWWQSGGLQEPMESRMHDLSDAFAIPGPRSVPSAFSDISTSKAQLRNEDGTVIFGVGTKFSMGNATTDLKTILTTLTMALTTFSTGLNVGNLAGNAAALVTAITTITTEINALLEAP